MYNLTPAQKALLRSIVEKIRAKQMPEEFTFMWDHEGSVLDYEGASDLYSMPDVTKGALDALAANDLLQIQTEPAIVLTLDTVRYSAELMRRLTRISPRQTPRSCAI